ncbi:MAG: L,D-transpeptidase family protein [Cytophagaceae bacterium]|nr:L,D-transpeptidase family protein [Cytophagaceae bacterium]
MRKMIFILLLLHVITGCDKKDDNKKDKPFTEKITSLFKKKIETEFTDSLAVEKFLSVHPEFKSQQVKIHKFYSRRNYQLAWSDKGEFLPQADMFVNLVRDYSTDGLDTFPDNNISQKLKDTKEARKPHREEVSAMRKDLDMLLTASFFQYSRKIWRGNVDPQNDNMEWFIDRKKIKFGKTLDIILADKENEDPFKDFSPLHKEYYQLKALLIRYKKMESAGGWAKVSLGSTEKLQKGDTSATVITLRKRLHAEGDLSTLTNDSMFDADVETAVKKFQRRNGLKEDGIVAGETIKEMNVSIQERINQIIVNMERWRWVPDKISNNYIWVNIPEFRLHVIENGKEAWGMNVIVGKAATYTPIFNDEIEYIVMSPTWNVPETIKRDELVPSVKKDSDFLARQNMEVLVSNKPVDPQSIDWNNLSEKDLRKMSFRQKPGSGNALGHVKFLFPNEFDVYLHDTPEGHLFSQAERDFSHGCIRIQEPQKFAEYLLKNDPSWTKEKISRAMHNGQEQFIKLKKKTPVYIVYFTAWMDKKGQANFREDLYKHDEKLAKAFFEN